MKRIILAALAAAAMACAGAASAQINTDGLSAAQVAELNAQAEKAREETQNPPPTRAEQVNEWVEIGQGIGSGLAAAARETGQVVNEFATTPVGQLTIVIIMFKVMGGEIIHLIVGLLYFAVTIPIWFTFYKRLWPSETVVTVYDETTKKRTTTKTRPKLDTDDENTMVMICFGWIALAVLIGFGMWITLG